MEVYIVNSEFDKLTVLDEYESFIWTERYSSYGDFEISLPPGSKWGWINPGSYIMQSETSKVMRVETREEQKNSDGLETTRISGRSLESILDDRAVFPNQSSTTNWSSSGPMGQIIKRLVDFICVDGLGYSSLDIIPGLYTVDETYNTDWIISSAKRQSLYSAIVEMCDSTNLGFSLTLQSSSPQFRFSVYEGTLRDGVIFSSSLENLTEERLILDWSSYKNTAYVWSKDGLRREIVVPKNGSVLRSGLDRKILHVDATDIDPASMNEATLVGALQQRGKEELAKHRKTRAFDGKILPGSGFRYQAHYSLGDIITLKDRQGNEYEVRVTEYIWASDGEGMRSYPTFVSTQEEV